MFTNLMNYTKAADNSVMQQNDFQRKQGSWRGIQEEFIMTNSKAYS